MEGVEYEYRTGIGTDIHRLVPDRPLVLGGVQVPFELGLLAHSDGDVVLHAVIDAVLGAAGLGDIGTLFPDSDPEWKDVDSRDLVFAGATAVPKEPVGSGESGRDRPCPAAQNSAPSRDRSSGPLPACWIRTFQP